MPKRKTAAHADSAAPAKKKVRSKTAVSKPKSAGTRNSKKTTPEKKQVKKKAASKKIPPRPRKPGQTLHWLMKSEPDVFSIDDLASAPDRTTFWDGVRNYQARNFMRDEMKVGDLVLYYHSNAEPPGIAGIARIAREGYPDHTAFDPKDKHYDPKSKKSEPTWYMVDVQLVKKFDREIPLQELRENAKLEGMTLLQKGSRLSVQPVDAKHFSLIEKMGTNR